jgi:colanic acid biosynthesis glycosyl transferase WcaI
MKILYVSQYYPPETAAPAARASELGRFWVKAGHEVTVLTGFPNHPTGNVHPGYRSKLWRLFIREDKDGVRINRTWLIPLANRKSWERMLNYASFFVSAALRGLFLAKPDVVIATSPQLLVGLSGLIIAKWKRVPLVFEVRDLWPESLAAVGVQGKKSLLMGTLGKAAGLLYEKAAHIVVVTPSFKEHLGREWGVPPEKISVVQNGVDHDFFSARPDCAEIIQEFGLKDRFVVGYIGTIGNAHGIETLVEVARLLNVSNPKIFFLVIGEGAEKEKLKRLVGQNKLGNVGIFPGQPRARIPSIVSASQLCLVLLRDSELFKTVIPTKMLEFMSCGRAVVAAVDGESARLIQTAGGGVCVSPGDARGLAEALRALQKDTELRRQMGEHAREFIVNNLTRQRTAEDYLVVLKRLMSSQTAPGSLPCREALPAKPKETAKAKGGTF